MPHQPVVAWVVVTSTTESQPLKQNRLGGQLSPAFAGLFLFGSGLEFRREFQQVLDVIIMLIHWFGHWPSSGVEKLSVQVTQDRESEGSGLFRPALCSGCLPAPSNVRSEQFLVQAF